MVPFPGWDDAAEKRATFPAIQKGKAGQLIPVLEISSKERVLMLYVKGYIENVSLRQEQSNLQQLGVFFGE